jgi:hypothetical protein
VGRVAPFKIAEHKIGIAVHEHQSRCNHRPGNGDH